MAAIPSLAQTPTQKAMLIRTVQDSPVAISGVAREDIDGLMAHRTGVAEVRQENREFKIEVALPTRIGAVVSSGMGLSLLATAEPLEYRGVGLQATDAHWVGDTIYALLR